MHPNSLIALLVGVSVGITILLISYSVSRLKAEVPTELNGAQVLCVDNEDSILVGMNSLLSRWGCRR